MFLKWLFHGGNPYWNLSLFVIFSVLLLFKITAHQSTYWELDAQYLLVHGLWKSRVVSWNEVTEVGWLGTTSGTIRINVGHDMESYDRLYVEPKDQANFVTALREFAPHAKFDLDSVGWESEDK